jgi:hypothetical protein
MQSIRLSAQKERRVGNGGGVGGLLGPEVCEEIAMFS